MAHLAKADDVVKANDIVAVVQQFVQIDMDGGTYKGPCPFEDDCGGLLLVSPKGQFKTSCGKSGDVVSFVELIHKVDREDALRWLARRSGLRY